jgi:formylglycine-generating enzyme required for sulfatase activity
MRITESVATQTAAALTATRDAILGANATRTARWVMATETAAQATLLALSRTQAWIDGWTDTPTPPPILNPLEVALNAARAFNGSNRDWQVLYPDGFQRTFEDRVTMVLVPAGCFMMGIINGYGDEQPVNEQCFDEAFWIDLTEVTQADFERLGGVQATLSFFRGDQLPVEQITWFEARDFCARRGARLPTEAEWEYAARGPDGLVYPWGNEWDEDAVWFGNANEQTSSVGSRPAGASWVGALDMSGNVWEWVSSVYEPYPYAADDGREEDTGDRTDVQRMLRGGSWWYYGNPDVFRAAVRGRDNPDIRHNDVGFRCARSS